MKNTNKRNLKQLPKRCFTLFLALLILLSAMPIASFALDFGSTGTVQKDGTIPGFSYNFSGGDGKALGLPHRNAQGQYDRLSVNGNVAYCIECGDKASVGQNTTVTDLTQLLRNASNMSSQEKARYVTYTLMYGYTGSTKYGYSADVERAATQAFVWLITTGDVADSSISNTCLFDPYTASLTAAEQNFFKFAFMSSSYETMNPTYAAQARDVVAKLKEQIYLHEVVPSFMSRTPNLASQRKVTLKYNASTKLFEAALTDTNGVLQDYQFSMNGVNFAKSGNTLKISTANLILTPTTLTAERVSNKYTAPADIVAGGYANNQDGCVAISRHDPMRAYMQLETEALGSAKLIKTSEDGKVEGVQLHISGNGVEKDVRTGKDGTITVENLIAGTYTATEKVDGFYVPQTAQTFTILPGQTTTVTFNNVLKRGSLTVTKTAEDGLLEGHRFHLFGTSDSGLEVNAYAVTDSTGKAYFKDILIGNGYTLEEVDTGIQYVVPDSQTTDIEWNTVTNASFENTLKKFTVTVQKQDSVTGEAQGDATLEGAVYGIYDGDKLVDTYTTDSNASFTTKEYICGENWSLRELIPSEGYLLDETVHHIGAEPGNFTIEHNPISMTVTENPILGQIAIIKHNDNGITQIETPEVGAEFEVYLKSAGAYSVAKDLERDLLTTDENGFAQTKDFPYGVYTVHQTKGNEGAEFIPDFDVVISEHGNVYRYLINNATFESYIKIVKKDKETGKVIPLSGAGFKLYDPQGKPISMSFTYPTPTTIDTFYTDTDGKLVTPEKLPYGKGYKAVEVKAPYGYVLDSTPVYFDITPETMQEDGALTVVTVEKTNMPQKGTIDITKLGEVFSSVSYDGTFYQPVFSLANNKGALFRITAAEDIVTPDGTVRAKKGTVVDTITIGSSTTKSKQLYLGKYLVEEIKAAYGMVLDPTVHEVTLSYAGQNVSVTSSAITITNTRQKAVIDLKKVLEQDDLFGLGRNNELQNVQFALYAAEPITAVDGSVIPKDGLLEILSLTENGTVQFVTDLPVGAKTYVQEYSTDEHYILSDTKYPVTFEYVGQDTAEVHITVNNGDAIENTLIRGNIFGYKVDDDGFAVGNALMGLFRPDETLFTEENALMTYLSNEIGAFGFMDVPYGNYVVREIEAPDGFVLNDTVYPVAITENEQVIEITVENRWITGNVQLIKVDGVDNDMRLSGFTFEVYVDVDSNGEFDAEIDKLVDTLKEEDLGVYSLTGLRYNGYFLHEAAQDGKAYLLDDGYHYFEIREDGETVTVSNADNGLFINTPILGSLVITKSDVSDGKLLPNVGFRIRDEKGEIVREGYTDENGVVRFDGLRYGKYTYQEFSADGYIVDDTEYPFEITENEQVISVTMTNEPIPVEIPKTGDVLLIGGSLAAVAVIASAAWITLAGKSRKKQKNAL